jgi:hypothetical protein
MLRIIRLQLFFKWSYYAEVWTVECRIFSVVLEPFSTSEQNRLCINCSSFSPVKHSGKYMNQQLEHKRFFIIQTNCICVVVWDNVVCIATCYCLDGPGIESWRKWDVPHPASYITGTRSFSWGYSGRSMALTTHPHLAPKLKKEWSYTSTPSLGLYDLFQVEFTCAFVLPI